MRSARSLRGAIARLDEQGRRHCVPIPTAGHKKNFPCVIFIDPGIAQLRYLSAPARTGIQHFAKRFAIDHIVNWASP
jgi:hypothetical protein